MNLKDDISVKLFDFHQHPDKLLSSFSLYCKPLNDFANPTRVSGRKLSQAYCPALISIIKQCNTELSKKTQERYVDYLLEIMHSSLIHLSKLHSFYYDDQSDYYNLWYIMLTKMNDIGRYKETLKLSLKITNELESTPYSLLLVNFYILTSNCILKNTDKGIAGLEQVYDLLAIKCKVIITNNKKDFDGRCLNKIYQNAFTLLMKTGKLLDNIAAGDIGLHEQALLIRTFSLQYLQKTKPLITSDYFAFAYSSILSCYKFASSFGSKILFKASIEAIDSALEISDLPFQQDKNLRSLLEFKSLLLFKIERFDQVKETLKPLLSSNENIIDLLYNIKYALEVAKASFLGKLELISDLENVLCKLNSFFDIKLTAPLSLTSLELQELKELAPKVSAAFDIWVKILANVHTGTSFKTGLALPVAILKQVIEMLKYVTKMVRFQEKLTVPCKIDLVIYNYTLALNSALIYVSLKDINYSVLCVQALASAVKGKQNLLGNIYNICLNLVHCGEKELALKICFNILESVNEITEPLISILELVTRYASDNLSQVKSAKKAVFEFLNRTLMPLPESNLTTTHTQIIELLCVAQLKEINLGGGSHSLTQQISCDRSLQSKILSKELNTYCKKLQSFQKVDASDIGILIALRIQEITKVLLWDLNKKYSEDYVNVLVEYIETVYSSPIYFQHEKIMGKLCEEIESEVTVNQRDKIVCILSNVIKHTRNPMLLIWNCVLILEKIKETEKTCASEWITRQSVHNYCKVIRKLKKAVIGFSYKLGCEVSSNEIDIVEKDNSTYSELSANEIHSILIASEISRMIKCYSLEVLFLNLLIINNDLFNGPLIVGLCLEYRRALALLLFGKQAVKVSNEAENIRINPDSDEFYLQLWTKVYYYEIEYLHGDLERSEQNLTEICAMLSETILLQKRGQLLKSYILYVLSCISLTKGSYKSSLSLCKESRLLLKDFHISTLTLHNLTLSNSFTENVYSKSPYIFSSSWSFQYLSFILSAHLSEIYTKLSMVSHSNILLSQGLKLGKKLGIPSIFLSSASKICTIHRQSNYGYSQENVREQQIATIQPVEFAEMIFQEFFSYFLKEITRKNEKIDDLDCLIAEDLEKLCEYLDRETLAVCLITLGDIMQTPLFYSQVVIQAAEQNYYKLAKFLLKDEFRSTRFTILRSMLSRKLGLLAYKQHSKQPYLTHLECSVFQIACCPQFIESLCGHSISIHLREELCFSLLNMSSALLMQSSDPTIYLQYITSQAYINHPLILNHAHYLLSRNPRQDNWRRITHVFLSIGVSYNKQSFFPSFTHEDLYTRVQSIPEGWTIIGLSIGRGNYEEGSIICRVQKAQDPACFWIGNKCCTGSQGLLEYLEEFSDIMKMSAVTTSKAEGVIKVSSRAWWDKRERLNDRLRHFVESLEKKYLGIMATLMVGKIKDWDIEKNIHLSAREIFEYFICECGQTWDYQIIYCLITAALCDLISVDEVKAYLLSSVYQKITEEVVKKIRILKKQTQGKILELHPVLLVISGHLLHIPWEAFSIFSNTFVSRLPSLDFLWQRQNISLPNYQDAYYILNPDKDLESTQRTFQGFFNNHRTWRGISEEAPSETQFLEALENRDLVIYCGHSSGEKYLKADKIRESSIKAVTLLLGCSSGLLRSQGCFEPQGIAIQYMIAGCPALLANLWDVTDKDIDRLAIEFFKNVERGLSVAQSLYSARSACKLRYLNGAAPVWYGIPFEFQL